MDGGTNMDRNGHVPRHRASVKQADSITASKWPIVTRTAYEQLTRGVLTGELVTSKKLLRLAHARQQLGLAMLALDNVLHDHRPTQVVAVEEKAANARVTGAVRQLRRQVEKGLVGFPLEVRG
jgi:hypothetical protein